MIYLRNRKGFSLIEVLFAFLILALSVIPLTRILYGNTPEPGETRREAVALFLAQGKMEEFKNSFSGEPPQVFTVSFTGYPNYTGTVQLEPESDFLQSITVTVSYEEAGEGKSITLQGLNAKRPQKG